MPRINIDMEVPEGRQCGCCEWWCLHTEDERAPALWCRLFGWFLETDGNVLKGLKCAECLEACAKEQENAKD